MFVSNFSLKTMVQKALCNIQEIMDFSADHPAREMRKIALRETVEYIRTKMVSALGFYTARELFDHSIDKISLESGYVLEFGVFDGGTINYLGKKKPKTTIHGFDSFEGLPEAWFGYNMGKGTFNRGGALPSVGNNVKLHKGWFNETLPGWIEQNKGPIAFLHIDCDLYSSTKTIFDLLGGRLVKGSVIVFDEYFGYPNWQAHEFRAFQEFVEKNSIKYEYLGYARIQTAVLIVDNPSSNLGP